jgi:hypothetical protein
LQLTRGASEIPVARDARESGEVAEVEVIVCRHLFD